MNYRLAIVKYVSAAAIGLGLIAPVHAAPIDRDQNLIGFWDFDEGPVDAQPPQGPPEGAFLDTSGAGTALDAGMLGGGFYRSDTPVGQTGPFGGLALELDGVDDRAFARPGANTKLEVPNVTVEAWVNLAAGATTQQLQFVVGYTPRGAGGAGLGYDLGVSANGHVLFSKGDGDASFDVVIGSTSLLPGVWNHIAGAYEFGANHTGRMRVFVNGVEDADIQEDRDGPGGIVYADYPGGGPIPKTLYFGAVKGGAASPFDYLGDTAYLFAGETDRVRIHDVAFDGNDPRLDYYAPEPATVALLVLGLAAIPLRRRRST